MKELDKSYNDEITFKELILKIKEYFVEVIKYWWIVGLFILVTAISFLYINSKHIPIYKAELRFVVEGQNGGGGGLGSLLGSFGIKKGGNVNPYKIIEVGKSTSLLIKVLSHKLDSSDNIANTILNEYKLPEAWCVNNRDFENFKFGNKIDINGPKTERKAIKSISSKIWGNKNMDPMTILKLDDETGIYSLSTESVTEELSLGIANSLYEEIKLFFEEEVFQNQKQLADILSIKADSIKALNESKIRQIAQFEDSNRAMVSNQSMVTKKILTQESIALSATYAEIMKNKEMTDISLKDMQPLFMAIDTPFSPIRPTSSSIVSTLIKGVMLGAFLAIILIVFRKIYKDIMSN